MPTLTVLRTTRRGSKSRQLLLDGEPWRVVSADVLALLELAGEADVDPAEVASAVSALEPTCARERALRLLTFRERSVAGLRARLEEDGYPDTVARAVVDDLDRVGLVDDERFAGMLARTVTRVRGLGRSRALRELAAAGIDEELARAALDEALSEDDEQVAARNLADAAASRAGATVDKVAGRLLRRGYRPGVALEAARAAMRSVDERLDDDTAETFGPDPLDSE